MSVFDPFLRVFSFKNASAVGKQALVHTDDRLQVHAHVNPSGPPSRSLVNTDTRLEAYALAGGKTVAFNKTADAAIKLTAGRVCRVSVLVAGSAVGAIHDATGADAAAAIAAVAAGNKIAVIPNTVGVYDLDLPCASGIVYIVGTGQTVAISYI